ncbi:MAG: TonB-dependent receptor [Bacteroidales bacterium]|nr:TonB-dependent receptor [Bacteroidales bacterium]
MKNRFSSLARWSLLLVALVCGTSLYAQRTITGTVYDAEMAGEPMVGATVQVKGTQTGTITDIDGKFSINAKNSDVLIFSFVGYDSKEVTVGNQNNLKVELGMGSQQLDEVVAIGYGTVKKSDLTGAVAVVSSKDLTKNPSTSVGQALQGKAPGVLVTQSGTPGRDANIRVRGVGSISKEPNPIYVVDGVITSGISHIAPTDIETMQVLKDASSAAIYGANGANGVVIITTKRGKSGKTQVNFNAFASVTMKPKMYDVMDASEYSNFYQSIKYNEANGYNGLNRYQTNGTTANAAYSLSPEFRKAYYGNGWEKGTDWQNEVFRTGFAQNYNVSISGGGENSNYSISLGYMKEKGTVIKSGADRFNVRANSDFKIGKWVKVGENIALSRRSTESPVNSAQGSIYGLQQSPLMKIYNSNFLGGFEDYQQTYYMQDNPDGSVSAIPTRGTNYSGPTWTNTLGNDKPNILVGPYTASNRKFYNNALISAYLEVNFTDWLQYKFTPSVDMNFNREKLWQGNYEANRNPGNASLYELYAENITVGVENQLTFKKTFADKHNLQVIAVHQMRKSDDNNISAKATGFMFEQLNTMANYTKTNDPDLRGYYTPYRMVSYLGRAMYDYAGKYLLTASIRADGVSVFAPGHRWGYFPSASVAWKLNEDFMQNVDVVDMLKLRFGWGQTGNSNIGGGFQYYNQISSATEFSPVFGEDQQVAQAQYVFTNFGSPDIKWEAADMYNIGVDLNMWRNRFQFSAEYYIKNQNNLLVQVPISSIFGRNGDGCEPWMNLGKLRNRGFEFNGSWRDQVNDFSYGVSANLTTIKNEVTSLPTQEIIKASNRTSVGHSIGSFYGYVAEGIIQATDEFYNRGVDGELDLSSYKFAKHSGVTPQPGDLKFSDLNGDGVVDALDQTEIGKTVPDFTYTFNLEFGYKGFDLSMFFYGVQNFDILNAQRASMESMNSQDMDHNKFNTFANNYWRPDRPSTEYVRADLGNENQNDRVSSWWVENGSFLRLKDLQLGYTLPAKANKALGISNARIYLSAQNLFMITKYKGRDPEAAMTPTEDANASPLSSGIDNGVYPIPRAFSIGLQVGF